MPDHETKAITLSKYRLSKSGEMLEDARTLFNAGSMRSCNNRAYYCIYHALRAVIALNEVEFKRHSGNIQYFLKTYIKTGIFPTEYSDMILSASIIRNSSDYDDFYIASREDTEQQLKNAEKFYQAVSHYLESQYRRS